MQISRTETAITRFGPCEGGGVYVVFGLMLMGFFGGMGLAIDYAIWADRKLELQVMADKAALEGALELTRGDAESADAKARAFIAEHGGTKGEIKISIDQTARTLGIALLEQGPRYFSVFHMFQDPDIAVSAQAAAGQGKGRLCALAVDPVGNPGIHMNGDGILSGADCIVWTNSQTGNAIKMEKSVSAVMRRICAVGGASNSSKGFVKPKPERDCPFQPDPYQDFSIPVPAGCNYTKFSSTAPVVYLTPGTYCDGITITSDKVVAAPGIYHIKGGIIAISGTSDVKFDGSTIYLSGSKVGITLKGDSNLRIVAPTEGPLANMAVVMDPNATASKESLFAGSSQIYISGVLHLPQAKIKISGDSVGVAELDNAMLIGNTIEFGGGAKWSWSAVERLPETDGGVKVTLTK